MKGSKSVMKVVEAASLHCPFDWILERVRLWARAEACLRTLSYHTRSLWCIRAISVALLAFCPCIQAICTASAVQVIRCTFTLRKTTGQLLNFPTPVQCKSGPLCPASVLHKHIIVESLQSGRSACLCACRDFVSLMQCRVAV